METIKSKSEILDDVVKLVKKQGRAIEDGDCKYLTTEGKVCGHSMALKPSYRRAATGSATSVIFDFGDKCHQKKYQGHDRLFWGRVQAFHDADKYWNKNNELTSAGLGCLSYLKKKYDPLEQ